MVFLAHDDVHEQGYDIGRATPDGLSLQQRWGSCCAGVALRVAAVLEVLDDLLGPVVRRG